jgi:hypothetical protein
MLSDLPLVREKSRQEENQNLFKFLLFEEKVQEVGHHTWIGNKLIEVCLERVLFENQSLEPLNPRILELFLSINWEKNLKF